MMLHSQNSLARRLRRGARAVCLALLALSMTIVARASTEPSSVGGEVLKATLGNGLRVIIVRNTLAPVVSTVVTYLVGSRDDPPDVPGMAHAQEHMMFRGTANLSTSELGTVATALGGDFNASTDETTTQFQFTVPADDLDAVLHIEADRMRDVLDAQAQWQQERGAIEQEVLGQESAPGGDFFRSLNAFAYQGTPYAHDGVGTRPAFDQLTGDRIKAFYDRWYAPNNAVLVIAGDIDPATALAQVRGEFAAIPKRAVPAHAAVHLATIARKVIKRSTSLVYPLAVVAFRLPGVNSPDFIPSFVLQAIIGSARGPLQSLVDSGEALDAEWVSQPYTPDAQTGFATVALGPGGDPENIAQQVESILTSYAANGVPPELFESTRRQLIADQELSRNSIEALASDWSTTIALDDEPSIAREQELLAQVTLAQVNAVAREQLDVHHAVIGELTPAEDASQSGPAAPAQRGPEAPLAAQPPVSRLPGWAGRLVDHVELPASASNPTSMKLSNGITLVVQPEAISNSVFLFGAVKTNAALQEPFGKEGVSNVLDATFAYGTQTQDRVAFQRVLDEADTRLAAGTGFVLQTTPQSFDRAVALLAQNELQPRLDEQTFDQARARAAQALATTLKSSDTMAKLEAAKVLYPAGDPELRVPSQDNIDALTLDDVKAYYAKIMRPDLTTIVVGNVTPEGVRASIESAFGSWHDSGATPKLDLPPLPLNRSGHVEISVQANQDYTRLEQVVPIPPADAQAYPLLLGNAILGGGTLGPEQSRLFRDLRQSTGLVYTVDSQLAPHRGGYQFTLEFACLPDNEQRITSLIDNEIERMKTEPVGDFELSLAKASLVRRTLIAGSSVENIGQSLLDESTGGHPFDQPRIDAQHFLATDAASIEKAFARYLQPDHFVRTQIMP
jgi:zinc protease